MSGTQLKRRMANAKLPEGFSFIEKVTDKEISASFEPLPKLILTMTRQDDLIFKQQQVDSLRLVTPNGEMGVKAGHEYTIAKLVPGVIEIEKGPGLTEKYFTSGGFAHVNNDGGIDINTVEAIPLAEFESAYVDRELLKCREELSTAKTDKEKAILDIYIETYEALQAALKLR